MKDHAFALLKVVLAIFALTLSVAGTARADFAAGVAAYDAQDYAKAYAEWFPLARDGDPAAERNIGHLFRHGYGVKKDSAEAVKWYLRAAEKGLARAQANVASMFLAGEGVEKDYGEAATWFYRAARQGHAIAQYNLGQMYQFGLGVNKDTTRAMAWYNLAAKAGYNKALDRMSALVLADEPPDAKHNSALAPPAVDEARSETIATQTNREEDGQTEDTISPPKGGTAPVGAVAADVLPPPPAVEKAVAEVQATPTPAAGGGKKEAEKAVLEKPGLLARIFGLGQPPQPPANVEAEGLTPPSQPAVTAKPAQDQPATKAKANPLDRDAAQQPAGGTRDAPANSKSKQLAAGKPDLEAGSEAGPVTKTVPTASNETASPPATPPQTAAASVEPPEERGFLTRLFGGGARVEKQEEASSGSARPAAAGDSTAPPAKKAGEDVTTIQAKKKPPTGSAEATKSLKAVTVTALPPPQSPKVLKEPATAAENASNDLPNEPKPNLAPPIVITRPATGPMEAGTKQILKAKLASSGDPADATKSATDFFPASVSIEWDSVLRKAAKAKRLTAPIPVDPEAAKAKANGKTKTEENSGSLANPPLELQRRLIDPIDAGLLAYRARDYATAVAHWLPLAHAGRARAQFYLGGLYHDGTGVNRDLVQAYVWWSLSAERGFVPAQAARERLSPKLLDAQLAAARAQVRSWRPVD